MLMFRSSIPGNFSLGDVAAFPLKDLYHTERPKRELFRRDLTMGVKSFIIEHFSRYDPLDHSLKDTESKV
ncbi:LOW QUALITY PROTEIN: hypothetical protein TorRG33x02_063650 [Trema orientale]|uniref:Uncharacterized protein n=1 Tax=Trema orientale TaxID=63057 RepID=A0A2P5FIZ5_TREOI|nr:LOW QUALITY PROTEIN: hypothetical protein TorRG33x02_063650 [Trema orientale]